MPANPKYLTKNPWQKFAKISAGILGGYLICALIHMILAVITTFKKEVIITSVYSFFIVWVLFMLLPFLFKNGWKAWLLYGVIIISLSGIYFLTKTNL